MDKMESEDSKATPPAVPSSPSCSSAGRPEPSLTVKVKPMDASQGKQLDEAIQRLVICLLQEQA